MGWENILKVDFDEARRLGEEFASEDIEEFDKGKMRRKINGARNHVYRIAEAAIARIKNMSDFPQKEEAIQYILGKAKIVDKMSPYRYIKGSNDKKDYRKAINSLERIAADITAKRTQAITMEAAYHA